jgi:hypothetical protein
MGSNYALRAQVRHNGRRSSYRTHDMDDDSWLQRNVLLLVFSQAAH